VKFDKVSKMGLTGAVGDPIAVGDDEEDEEEGFGRGAKRSKEERKQIEM
jgi:hypothetical protein